MYKAPSPVKTINRSPQTVIIGDLRLAARGLDYRCGGLVSFFIAADTALTLARAASNCAGFFSAAPAGPGQYHLWEFGR
jgi:hypothetical protein